MQNFQQNYLDNFRSIFPLSRMGKDIIVSTLATALSVHSKESAQFIFTNSHKFRGVPYMYIANWINSLHRTLEFDNL
jgi:hypothetical protein